MYEGILYILGTMLQGWLVFKSIRSHVHWVRGGGGLHIVYQVVAIILQLGFALEILQLNERTQTARDIIHSTAISISPQTPKN